MCFVLSNVSKSNETEHKDQVSNLSISIVKQRKKSVQSVQFFFASNESHMEFENSIQIEFMRLKHNVYWDRSNWKLKKKSK